MKKLILLIAILIGTNISTFAQAPEKASSIIATQADSIGLRDKVLKVLADKDYTVSSGKTAPVISTAAKTLKNGARVHFSFQFVGNDIIVTGKLPVAGQSSMTISNQGKKGTPILNGWEEMEKIAKALGGKISYK